METTKEIDFITILLPLAGIAFLIALGVIFMFQQFQKNIIRQQLEKEEAKNEYQKELLHTTIKVQEEERQRIANDLHDELAATLSISKMQLSQLERLQEFNPERITEVRELIETTLSSTRRISHELMPPQLSQLGLEKAIISLLQKAESAKNIETNLAVNIDSKKVPWLLKVALYRIYSELINNTLKHAEASNIDVSILLSNHQLFCRYSDDGKGLPKELLNQGMGMISLKNRVNAFEGEIEFGNSDLGGFYCNIKVPIQTNKEETNKYKKNE